MKKLTLVLAGALLAVVFVACDSENGTSDVIGDTTETAPVCSVVPSEDVKGACEQYRENLCSRHVECATYGSMAECDTWFNTNYGDCADAPTTALEAAKQAKLKTCLCELPDAACTLLSTNGAEATIPECGEF